VSPTVWVGSSCNTVTSQPSSCQSIPSDVTLQNFYNGAGTSSAPAQHIPVRSLINPVTTSNPESKCIETASSSNSLFILFPFDSSMPDYCQVTIGAKTTKPATPRNLKVETGDQALTLNWEAPPTGTPDMPVSYQVLCIDRDGAPIDQGGYGFGDSADKPHRLAYSVCLDPEKHKIQRRYIAETGGTDSDGGTNADLGVQAQAGLATQDDPIGIEGSNDDAGLDTDGGTSDGGTTTIDAGSTCGTIPPSALASLLTLNRKYVVTDPVTAVGSALSVRVPNLANGDTYACIVLGVDRYGNASKSDVACGTPQPVQDLYRRFLADGGKQTFCFIATAAYGSYQHPYVQILRDFRDEALLPHAWGRAFVEWYYRTSPPYAQWIAQHDTVRAMVRVALWPLIGYAWVHLHLSAAEQVAVLALLLSLAVLWRRARKASTLKTVKQELQGADAVGGAA
jgi:hypothetical protein